MIALCMNTPGMGEGDWMDKDYGKKFPGAGWMPYLADTQGVWSGETILAEIKKGKLDPKDVVVVQEERNGIGIDLVGMGSDPRVLLCLESPIYAPDFYDNIPQNFRHRILFDGGTEHAWFPSFDEKDVKDPVPWKDRKFLCMVTANKHYSMLPRRKTPSPTYTQAMSTQLQDYRYGAINHFSGTQGFDLYGRGWFGFANPVVAKDCRDKLATIRGYKFALCFENGSYPGYVTEKMIDCFVAGVIPVYRGAPDIEDFVPSNLFIDARNAQSFREMENHLRALVDCGEEVSDMISDAQAWLGKAPGRNFNNRVFADHILELCR